MSSLSLISDITEFNFTAQHVASAIPNVPGGFFKMTACPKMAGLSTMTAPPFVEHSKTALSWGNGVQGSFYLER